MAVFLLKANEARARACLSVKLFSTDPTVGVAYEDVGLDCERAGVRGPSVFGRQADLKHEGQDAVEDRSYRPCRNPPARRGAKAHPSNQCTFWGETPVKPMHILGGDPSSNGRRPGMLERAVLAHGACGAERASVVKRTTRDGSRSSRGRVAYSC
eukprot:scaffold7205_cov149-Isochrysis_galbana.AAC.3